VWLRDAGRCAFTGRNGRSCAERAYLEFHHVEDVEPWAIGGETTADNLSLRCRAHNAHEAELVFGARTPAVREAPVQYMGWAGETETPRELSGGYSTRPGASTSRPLELERAPQGRALNGIADGAPIRAGPSARS
jgi:hypothetical protein